MTTLDEYMVNGAIAFVATAFGVFLALLVTRTYDRSKKRADENETKKRILTAMREELSKNLDLVIMLSERNPDFQGLHPVSICISESFQSCVNSGDFSLLGSTAQTSLSYAYLLLRNMQEISAKLVESLGPNMKEPLNPTNVWVVLAKKQSETIQKLVPIAIESVNGTLANLK